MNTSKVVRPPCLKMWFKKCSISEPRNKTIMKMFNLIRVGERAVAEFTIFSAFGRTKDGLNHA